MSRKLIIEPYAGLANRLRVLNMAERFARLSKRELILIWKIHDKECACAFSDLFTNQFKMLEDIKDFREGQFVQSFGQPVSIYSSNIETLYIKSTGLHYGFFDRNACWNGTADYFNKLIPVNPIQERINAFVDAYFTEYMLGVHIRRSDNPHFKKFKDSGDEKGFENRFINEILKYTRKYPQAKIFLATDDGNPLNITDDYTYQPSAMVMRFKDIFKEKIVMFPVHAYGRHTKEGIQEALIELYLLNYTHFVIGTLGSSFSRMAIMKNLSVRKRVSKCIKTI